MCVHSGLLSSLSSDHSARRCNATQCGEVHARASPVPTGVAADPPDVLDVEVKARLQLVSCNLKALYTQSLTDRISVIKGDPLDRRWCIDSMVFAGKTGVVSLLDHYVKSQTSECPYDSKKLGVICGGTPGSGKCWSPTDRLMRFDGTEVAVADVNVGDHLMGATGRCRIVANGSINEGYGRMYEVTFSNTHDNLRPFTCTANHILVLIYHAKPTVTSVQPGTYGVIVHAYNPVKMCVVGTIVSKHTLVDDAIIACDVYTKTRWAYRARDRTIPGQVFTISMGDFMHKRFSALFRGQCRMFQSPGGLDFASPAKSLKMRLCDASGMGHLHGEVKTCAWMIGMWIASGIRLPGASDHESDAGYHESSMGQSCGIMLSRYMQLNDVVPSSHTMRVGRIIVSIGTMLWSIIESYGMMIRGHVSHELLRETRDVRSMLLCGIEDGLRTCDSSVSFYQAFSRDRTCIGGITHLSRGLGRRVTSLSSSVDSGFHIRISSCSLVESYLDDDVHGFSFDVCSLGGMRPYRGFHVVRANGASCDGRIVNADFVVTHNSTLVPAVANYLQRNVAVVKFDEFASRQEFADAAKYAQTRNLILQFDEFDLLLESITNSSAIPSNAAAREANIVRLQNDMRNNKGVDDEVYATVRNEYLEALRSRSAQPIDLPFLQSWMDGESGSDGRVILASTNYPERIPKPLLRPGRFDIRLSLGAFTSDQIHELLRLMYALGAHTPGSDSSDPDSAWLATQTFPDKVWSPAAIGNVHRVFRNLHATVNCLVAGPVDTFASSVIGDDIPADETSSAVISIDVKNDDTESATTLDADHASIKKRAADSEPDRCAPKRQRTRDPDTLQPHTSTD